MQQQADRPINKNKKLMKKRHSDPRPCIKTGTRGRAHDLNQRVCPCSASSIRTRVITAHSTEHIPIRGLFLTQGILDDIHPQIMTCVNQTSLLDKVRANDQELYVRLTRLLMPTRGGVGQKLWSLAADELLTSIACRHTNYF